MDTGQDNGTLRVSIREAAARLGVTEAAIRKRIQRGSLDKKMGEDGKVYLDLSQDMSNPESQVHRDAPVEDLREQVHYLRSVLNEERDARRRADTIIAQLTQANAVLAQRVPELEAPTSPEPSGVFEEPERAEPRSGTGGAQEATERLSDTREVLLAETRLWWRKVFGG